MDPLLRIGHEKHASAVKSICEISDGSARLLLLSAAYVGHQRLDVPLDKRLAATRDLLEKLKYSGDGFAKLWESVTGPMVEREKTMLERLSLFQHRFALEVFREPAGNDFAPWSQDTEFLFTVSGKSWQVDREKRSGESPEDADAALERLVARRFIVAVPPADTHALAERRDSFDRCWDLNPAIAELARTHTFEWAYEQSAYIDAQKYRVNTLLYLCRSRSDGGGPAEEERYDRIEAERHEIYSSLRWALRWAWKDRDDHKNREECLGYAARLLASVWGHHLVWGYWAEYLFYLKELLIRGEYSKKDYPAADMERIALIDAVNGGLVIALQNNEMETANGLFNHLCGLLPGYFSRADSGDIPDDGWKWYYLYNTVAFYHIRLSVQESASELRQQRLADARHFFLRSLNAIDVHLLERVNNLTALSRLGEDMPNSTSADPLKQELLRSVTRNLERYLPVPDPEAAESTALHRLHDSKWPLNGLGDVERALRNSQKIGDSGEIKRAEHPATQWYEASRAVAWLCDDRNGRAWSSLQLADLSIQDRKYADALRLCREAIQLWWQLGDFNHIASAIETLALMAAQQSNWYEAVRLASAAQRLRELKGLSANGEADGTYRQQRLQRAARHLDGAKREQAVNEGRRGEVIDIIAFSLRVTSNGNDPNLRTGNRPQRSDPESQ